MYIGTLSDFLNIGGGEMVLIVAAILLLFGGKKLPELARGLGKGIREFKDASDSVKREIHRNINEAGVKDDIDEMIREAKDDLGTNNAAYPASQAALETAAAAEIKLDESFEHPEPPVETGVPNTVPVKINSSPTTSVNTEKTNS